MRADEIVEEVKEFVSSNMAELLEGDIQKYAGGRGRLCIRLARENTLPDLQAARSVFAMKLREASEALDSIVMSFSGSDCDRDKFKKAVRLVDQCDDTLGIVDGAIADRELLDEGGVVAVSEVERLRSDVNKVGGMAAETLQAVKGDGRKPAGGVSYDDALEVMRRICGSDAVGERTLRRWFDQGRAGKSGLAFSYANMASMEAWTAFCQSYRERMTGRLRCKVLLSERNGR